MYGSVKVLFYPYGTLQIKGFILFPIHFFALTVSS